MVSWRRQYGRYAPPYWPTRPEHVDEHAEVDRGDVGAQRALGLGARDEPVDRVGELGARAVGRIELGHRAA